MEENVDTMKWHNNVASRSFPIIFRLFAFGEPLGGHYVPTESVSRRNMIIFHSFSEGILIFSSYI